MSRGVLYVWWGDEVYQKLVDRSIASLKQHHPELPVHVHKLPDGASLLDKARMQRFSPFDETLFLDTDTVVLGRLDYGFEKAARHGLACAICECPWAMRYEGITGDLVEYNTGVLFFTRKARPVFDAWERLAPRVDSKVYHYNGSDLVFMPENDQASFAKAVDETGFVPFVLPLNWNFRPMWNPALFGPLRIWHDGSAVPEALIDFNRDQNAPDAVIRYIRAG